MSVLCAGAAHWDIIARTDAPAPRGADLPGEVIRRPGGVACNIAQHLRAPLIALVGDDAAGVELAETLALPGLITVPGQTDRYIAIEDANGLVAAIAQTNLLDTYADRIIAALAGETRTVLLDGNLPEAACAALAPLPDLRVIPASPAKALRLRPLMRRGAAIYCNRAEARALTQIDSPPDAARALCQQGARFALVTDGPSPACLARGDTAHVATPPAAHGAITGAGDALVAGHVRADLSGASDPDALSAALAAAAAHINGTSP